MKFVSAFTMVMSLIVSAQAKELVCWDKYGKRGDSPFVRAQIVADNELHHVTFKVSAHIGWTLDDLTLPTQLKSVKGTLITSKRSPYSTYYNQSNNDFVFQGGRLVLPSKLNSQTLTVAVQSGISKNGEKGVNGVVITSWKDSDAGNHKSIRLVCRIYGEYSAN